MWPDSILVSFVCFASTYSIRRFRANDGKILLLVVVTIGRITMNYGTGVHQWNLRLEVFMRQRFVSIFPSIVEVTSDVNSGFGLVKLSMVPRYS